MLQLKEVQIPADRDKRLHGGLAKKTQKKHHNSRNAASLSTSYAMEGKNVMAEGTRITSKQAHVPIICVILAKHTFSSLVIMTFI